MPRYPRLFIPGACYHVYCRVARGEFVFDDPLEADEFIAAVQRVRDLEGWRILAWVLMGNHYHLVVKTSMVPLWRSMLRLQSDVARGFNKRHRYLGRLWQSRYRARVIDTQDYFRQAVSYVHLNPVAAGIVSDPSEHPYCGHGEIIGDRQARLVDASAVLRGFDDGLATDPRDRYLSWIRQVAELRWNERGIRELPWWRDAEDLSEIASPARHPVATTFDDHKLEDDRVSIEIGRFIRLFEHYSGHPIEELRSPLRTPDLVEGRIELATLAVGRYKLRSTEVALATEKHPASIARWIKIGLVKQQENANFRERIDRLDRRISSSARNNA
jgi:REP element-mobilizing transposase RayT